MRPFRVGSCHHLFAIWKGPATTCIRRHSFHDNTDVDSRLIALSTCVASTRVVRECLFACVVFADTSATSSAALRCHGSAVACGQEFKRHS
eukprot:1843386-Amphidinium_carterae.2